MVFSSDSRACGSRAMDNVVTFHQNRHYHHPHHSHEDSSQNPHKRRSFMVTDILTDQASSPSIEDCMDTTNKTYNTNQYALELTANSPELRSSTSPGDLDARASNSPADLGSYAISEESIIYGHPLKRPRVKSPSRTITSNGVSNASTLFDAVQTPMIHSPHSPSDSSNGSDLPLTNGTNAETGTAPKPLNTRYTPGLKSGKKLRKARTAFTDQQLNELEHSFDRQKYLAVQDRMELAARLGLSDMQVKTWYQNRRTKWKRQTAVGLELLAEADNFVAVQRLLQQSTYWAYHPAAQCILGNGDPLGRSHASSTGSETELTTNLHKSADSNKTGDTISSFNKSPITIQAHHSKPAENGNHSIATSICNVPPPQPFSGAPMNLSYIPGSTFCNGSINLNSIDPDRNPGQVHMLNPVDLFWLSNWLTQAKASRTRAADETCPESQPEQTRSRPELSIVSSENNET